MHFLMLPLLESNREPLSFVEGHALFPMSLGVQLRVCACFPSPLLE